MRATKQWKYYEWVVLPSAKFTHREKGYMLVDVRWPDDKHTNWLQEFRHGTASPDRWPAHYLLKGKNQIRWWDNLVSVQNDKIVSNKAKAIFEQLAPGETDFLPVSIQASDGAVRSDYYLVIFRNVLKCMDMKKSVYSMDKDMPGHIMPPYQPNVVLDTLRIGDSKMFRISQAPCYMMVREDVKDAIEKAGLTGFGFYRIKAKHPDKPHKRSKE